MAEETPTTTTTTTKADHTRCYKGFEFRTDHAAHSQYEKYTDKGNKKRNSGVSAPKKRKKEEAAAKVVAC